MAAVYFSYEPDPEAMAEADPEEQALVHTVTPPLHHHYIAVTSPLHHRYMMLHPEEQALVQAEAASKAEAAARQRKKREQAKLDAALMLN